VETPEEDEEPSSPSAKPKPITKRMANNVLCGRGLPTQTYHGNGRIHSIAAEYREQYIALPRKEKPALIKAIVQELKAGGARFLKRSEDDEDT
jgi:hypothetical protein